MEKYYKINITINDNDQEITDEIVVTRTFNGFFFQEIITNKKFYPLYRDPVNIDEFNHNGEFINGNKEIKRQINKNGYSMIMFLDENRYIEEIKNQNEIKEYYNNFQLSNFAKYISKDIQKKKIIKRKK